MKKFLRIRLPHSAKEVPLTLDASILASAAMRARSFRRRRILLKAAFPTIAAAAAVTVITAGIFDGVYFAGKPAAPTKNIAVSHMEIGKLQNQVTLDSAAASDPAPAAELLALADISVLEQESYNLASMAEFTIDGESMMI